MAWHEITGAQALGDEEAMGAEVGGQPIALCRSAGEYHAVHGICTHQHALLADGYVEDGALECPLHQGRFDLKTGAALCAPITEPLRVYPVRAEDGKVFVQIQD